MDALQLLCPILLLNQTFFYVDQASLEFPSRGEGVFWRRGPVIWCPQLGWISLTTLQEVDIYQQMTVVTLVF